MKQHLMCIVFAVICIFGHITAESSCRTPNGEIAYCVSIYDCHIFLDVLKSNTLTPQITDFLRESQCEAGDTLKVCCGSFVDYENATNRAVNRNHLSNMASLPNEECGKFYGDKYAGKLHMLKINEYPWAALIEYKNNEGSTGHHCGAVLISKDFVLTAAHCVLGNIVSQFGNAYQVRLGEYDRSTEKDCVDIINGTYTCYDNHQNIIISKIFVHPQYNCNNGSYINDIALLKLEKSATFSDFIRPVCLTTENVSPAGTEYSAVGWGINENSKGQVTKLLVKALVFQNQQCSEVNPANTTLSSSQFCAVKSGAQEKIMYCGDAGGAIVNQVNDQNGGASFVLQGIQSFNFNKNNDSKNSIIVYTKTSEYVNWILEQMRL